MNTPSIIAIDGPAASGKTSVGKRLADQLKYLFFDTGLMYRAVTWAALQAKIKMHDEVKITELAEKTLIEIGPASQDDGRACDVLANGQDITWDIRLPEVDSNVSVVSAYPGVRTAMTAQQRRIGLRGQIVMVGRDVGTVILPEADLKIYLDASVEERARRRWKELQNRGEIANHEDVLGSMRRRDKIDSTRAVAPLRPAEDAILINSDQLKEEQVLEKLLELAK